MDFPENFDALPNTARLTTRQVLTLVPFSRTTLWRRINDGSFPKPRRLPGCGLGTWTVGDIRGVLAADDDMAA